MLWLFGGFQYKSSNGHGEFNITKALREAPCTTFTFRSPFINVDTMRLCTIIRQIPHPICSATLASQMQLSFKARRGGHNAGTISLDGYFSANDLCRASEWVYECVPYKYLDSGHTFRFLAWDKLPAFYGQNRATKQSLETATGRHTHI